LQFLTGFSGLRVNVDVAVRMFVRHPCTVSGLLLFIKDKVCSQMYVDANGKNSFLPESLKLLCFDSLNSPRNSVLFPRHSEGQ
jgi:hypothetical protein